MGNPAAIPYAAGAVIGSIGGFLAKQAGKAARKAGAKARLAARSQSMSQAKEIGKAAGNIAGMEVAADVAYTEGMRAINDAMRDPVKVEFPKMEDPRGRASFAARAEKTGNWLRSGLDSKNEGQRLIDTMPEMAMQRPAANAPNIQDTIWNQNDAAAAKANNRSYGLAKAMEGSSTKGRDIEALEWGMTEWDLVRQDGFKSYGQKADSYQLNQSRYDYTKNMDDVTHPFSFKGSVMNPKKKSIGQRIEDSMWAIGPHPKATQWSAVKEAANWFIPEDLITPSLKGSYSQPGSYNFSKNEMTGQVAYKQRGASASMRRMLEGNLLRDNAAIDVDATRGWM